MAETAQELISSLGPKKTADLVYKFENSSREHWHFFPNWSGRKGIPLSQFSKKQKGFIKEMLHLLLTSEAFQEQEKIRLIHGLRKDLTDPNNPMNLYYLSIFGSPSTNRNWGWRFEGHHLSLNCTLVDGKLFSVTPSFWGSSPIRANDGDDHQIEVFEDEQKLSLSLVESLTEGQKFKAVLNRTNGPQATSKIFRKDIQNEQGLPFYELKSTQHAAWRDFDGDFGRDLIKQHLTKENHP